MNGFGLKLLVSTDTYYGVEVGNIEHSHSTIE